jgi:tetratricopeptide (TPR) repeat protein
MTTDHTLDMPAPISALEQALIHQREGRLSDAEAIYRAMLIENPNHADANHQLGLLAMQLGQPHVALAYIIAALSGNPENSHYWLSYIEVLIMTDQGEVARPLLAKEQQRGLNLVACQALALKLENLLPNEPAVEEINLLASLFNEGRYSEVVSLAQQITMRFPLHGFGWKVLGAALKLLNQNTAAVSAMQISVEVAPNDAQAHNNLGITQLELGLKAEAEGHFRQAIQIQPDWAEAHNNLGSTLQETGRLQEAKVSQLTALRLKPNFAEALNNLGNTLLQMDQLEEAGKYCLQALEIDPGRLEAYNNLASIQHKLGKLDEAETYARHALELNPQFAAAHYNLSLILLQSGQYADGWKEYEYRWEGGTPKSAPPKSDLPLWTGQPLKGSRILIFAEQGLGDTIQFSRYLALLEEEMKCSVSVVVDGALIKLLRHSFPAVEFLQNIPTDQSGWHYHCPLLSLPRVFQTTLDNLPNITPYLIPEPLGVAHWGKKITDLSLPATAQKIGLVWKPGSRMQNAPLRSLALQQLAPLFSLSNCQFFSAQIEPCAEKAVWVNSGRLIDWGAEFTDFNETAAFLMNMDTVISVDTAVAHLAGALGRPTWLLNRHAGEWRWLHQREDSPWYPTMRIFTQKMAGDWQQVVDRIVDEFKI